MGFARTKQFLFILTILCAWPGSTHTTGLRTRAPRAESYIQAFESRFAQRRSFQMDGKKWKQQQAALLPYFLCNEDSYFRVCFGTSEQDCQKQVLHATQVCASETRTPASLDPHAEGQQLALQLGHCVGLKLEQAWSKRKHLDNKCYDAHAGWM